MHGLVRCKHERRCSRSRGEDVSFRDVKIKILDRNCYQGMWMTSRTGSVGWDLSKSSELSSCLRTRELRFRPVRARRLCALRAPRVGLVESWRCKRSQHRKIVSLSPHIEKPFNSKVIKVSYLNQFRVLGSLYKFMNILWTLCLFHISVSWVCYIYIYDMI